MRRICKTSATDAGWPGAMRRHALVLLCIAFWAAFGSAGSGNAQTRFDPEALDTHIRDTLERNRVPGAAVIVVVDKEIPFLRTYGQDGRGAPVTDQTVFRLGSMSKAFTALVAMRLVERDVIALETPVTTVLPALTMFQESGATLAHLLRHTSGLPTRAPQAAPNASLSKQVAALGTIGLVAPAGAEHIYSNANYLVAARMLEAASGERFQGLVAREVFEPLGFSDPAKTTDGRSPAFGHRFWGPWPVPYRPWAETGRLPTASVTANAEDIARFLRFQLGDGIWESTRLLSQAGMDRMHEGVIDGDGFRYALGWRDGTLRGERAIWHGGVLPDHQGMMVLLPEREVGIAVLLNASSTLSLPARPTSHRLAADIAEMALGETPRPFRISFSTWLAGLWMALGAVLLHQLYTVVRVLSGRDPASRPLRAAGLDAAIMLALIVGLPLYLGLSWPQFARQVPDLTIWMVVMTGLTVVGGLRRVRQWRKARNSANDSLEPS